MNIFSFKSARWLIWGLPLAFLALFYFYPLGAILGLSFAPDGRLAGAPFSELIETSYYGRILWFTTWQAVVSTVLTVGLALPGAYVFAHYRFPGKTTIKTLITLPFVLPTVVVAHAFLALLGPQGVLNGWLMGWLGMETPPIQLHHTIWMILLAHVFYNYSVALRMMSHFWQNLNPDLTSAAQMLGVSPGRAFRHVTWPLLQPAIRAAAVLVFIFSFTSFGVVLILGGPRFATLEVEIYQQAVDVFNLPVAATLSLIQMAFTFVLMWFYTRAQAGMAQPLQLRSGRSTERPIQTMRDRWLVGSNLLLMGGVLVLPLAALITHSFQGAQGLTLRFYRELFVNRLDSIFYVPPGSAIFNSIGFALVTVVLAGVLGLSSALLLTHKFGPKSLGLGPYQIRVDVLLTNLLDPLLMLPLATSAVTLGFGHLIALDKPPLNLRQSLILVPIVHTLVAMPFVIRSLLPAIRRISPRLREAATMLGANPQQVWRAIDWPLMQRALLIGAVFAFTISMGEFGATVFVVHPQTPTMSIAIYRFWQQPGALNDGQALAMSSLLMLVCALGFVVIERFRIGDEGEF